MAHKLEELRKQIDQLDDELVTLLNKRADLVLGIKEAKQRENIDVYSSARERQILDRVTALARGGNFPLSRLEEVFRNIISATRSLIGELTIAYVGPAYSLAHEAAQKQFGSSVAFVAQSSAQDVVTWVDGGDAQYGVLPADTNSSGLVVETFDALIGSHLQIIAEVEVEERYSLLASKKLSLRDISRVVSDANSFARCGQWLRANLPEVPCLLKENVSQALDEAKHSERTAVVALESIAQSSKFELISSTIMSESSVAARFIVVGHRTPERTGNDKTTLLCSVQDRAGVLRELLKPFSERGITLVKIESRTMKSRGGDNVFFVDCLGHQADEDIAAAIRELQQQTSYLRILGSYPVRTDRLVGSSHQP